MSLSKRVLVLVLLGGAAAAWSAPKDADVEQAGRQLGKVAHENGLSEGDARHAIAVLERLVLAGLPVPRALEIVADSVERKLAREELAALGAGVENAYRRGATPRELVNLTEDLAGADAGTLLSAIEAVGRLAEEGYTDAETRRGVGLRVRSGREEGLRGQELAEALRDDARNDAEKGKPENGPGSVGQGKSGAAKDKQKDKIPPDLRDERKGKPPGGPPPDKGKPGGKK